MQLQRDVEKREFVGATDNVSRLALRLDGLPPEKPISVELDGQRLDENPGQVLRSGGTSTSSGLSDL